MSSSFLTRLIKKCIGTYISLKFPAEVYSFFLMEANSLEAIHLKCVNTWSQFTILFDIIFSILNSKYFRSRYHSW